MANQNIKQIKSEFFSLQEFTHSKTADRLKINNEPNADVIQNIQYGTDMILDPLRRLYQKPIVITSGYRCEKLNKTIGGVPNSWHTKGNAADIRIENDMAAKEIFNILKSIPSVDTVLFEHSKNSQWMHIQWDMQKTPRHHFNFNYQAK